MAAWIKTAEQLDAQGEVVLAGEVRYFAQHLPPVLTDKERLAQQYIRYQESLRSQSEIADKLRQRDDDLTR